MANGFYNAAKQHIVDGSWQIAGMGMNVVLVDSGYPFDATETDDTAILAHAVAGPISVSAIAVDGFGTVTANSAVFTGVSAGLTVKAVILLLDDAGLNKPILYLDTGTGLPLTTTGGNVTVNWNSTPTNGQIWNTLG